MKRRFAVVPGDGIGVDVTREAVKAIEAAAAVFGFTAEMDSYDFGADRYLRTGETLPPGSFDLFRTYDAVFMGAFGDPRVVATRDDGYVLGIPPPCSGDTFVTLRQAGEAIAHNDVAGPSDLARASALLGNGTFVAVHDTDPDGCHGAGLRVDGYLRPG